MDNGHKNIKTAAKKLLLHTLILPFVRLCLTQVSCACLSALGRVQAALSRRCLQHPVLFAFKLKVLSRNRY